MSYFGNEGPPQDGGFIGGIARGSARLHNAKVTRARYQKGIGSVNRHFPLIQSDYPSDEILYERTKNFTDGYEGGQAMKEALADNRVTQAQADPILKQYENDRAQIAKWAEQGPYVHETKALGLGLAPLWIGVAGYLIWSNWRVSPAKGKGHKSSLYAVFS